LDFTEVQVSVVVASDVAIALEFAALHRAYQSLFAHGLDKTFRQNDHAVLSSFGAALENGADDNVAHFVQGHWPAAELLGNYYQRSRGGLANAQSQMPCGPAHADDNIPTGGRAGIFSQVA